MRRNTSWISDWSADVCFSFSSRRRHTRCLSDWSSDVCSSDLDENFLLQRQRAMDLLALMKAAGKSWSFNIFSSANAIRKYKYEELVELGVSSIWLGLESAQSGYAKLEGADTLQLTRELREHGIVLLGSTILGLEHHTPENIG